jgi:hypothetical protein
MVRGSEAHALVAIEDDALPSRRQPRSQDRSIGAVAEAYIGSRYSALCVPLAECALESRSAMWEHEQMGPGYVRVVAIFHDP